MKDLIKRLEAAEVGSRELDWAVGAALFTGVRGCAAPNTTTSLDAALALAERVLPEVFWEMSCRAIIKGQKQYGVTLWPEDLEAGVEGAHGHAPTPALALCIAILRAARPS